jgi:CO dehydrogenase nickel-insertion accessory protein CooC1
MNNQINLAIDGKGGVGKSFFATNLVQTLKDGCIAHCVLDTDQENSTPMRFHPKAEFLSLKDKRGLDGTFRGTRDEQFADH